MSRSLRDGLAAALVFFAVALLANRAVLPDPFTLLPTPRNLLEAEKPGPELLYRSDQDFVLANTARVAYGFTHHPRSVGETGLCAPLDRPFTLGEHMFAQGLLGALPHLLTGDPIFTYNAVAILSVWISALSMYVLAFYWTRSFAAALTAGLAFALHPDRLNNPAHLFVFGNAWTALALLAAHRLFARGRWRDAALLTACLCLQLLESFYPVLGLAIVGGTYGLCLAAKHVRQLPRLAPKLAVVAAITAVFAWWVLGPYLETQAAWGVLGGRRPMLLHPSRYLPGQPASAGWVVTALAAVGLVDRLRGPRVRDDPRLPLLLAGFVLFWCTVWSLPVPGLGAVRSPLLSLAAYVPGLESVRALAALKYGVFLVLAALAAFGVVALLEPWTRSGRLALATALIAAVLAQTFYAPLAEASFASKADLEAFAARPPDDELALLETLPPGAVLDLPLAFEPMRKVQLMPAYLRAAAYHHRAVAACYNSFLSGLQSAIESLAAALPDRAAAQSLSALGFTSLRLHHRQLGPARERLAPLLQDPRYVRPLGRTSATSAYELLPQESTSDFASLASPTPPAEAVTAARPRSEISFRFRGGGDATFVHPRPIQPSVVTVRWTDGQGKAVLESPGRMLLPAALAKGASTERTVEVDLPASPGPYTAELLRAADPGLVLARRTVQIR